AEAIGNGHLQVDSNPVLEIKGLASARLGSYAVRKLDALDRLRSARRVHERSRYEAGTHPAGAVAAGRARRTTRGTSQQDVGARRQYPARDTHGHGGRRVRIAIGFAPGSSNGYVASHIQRRRATDRQATRGR